jgi:hypothetical protein
VYCWKEMKSYAEIQAARGTVADQASIEHLNFDGPFSVRDGLRNPEYPKTHPHKTRVGHPQVESGREKTFGVVPAGLLCEPEDQ